MDYIVTEEECGQTSALSPLDLIEGHSYFVSVKVCLFLFYYIQIKDNVEMLD